MSRGRAQRGDPRSRGADIDGVLLVDKPSGPTSFDVVRDLRRGTGARKVGHAGTLDPLADGLLLVCLGEATKAVPWLMDAAKEYVATVALGVETDTLDAQGEVTARRDVPPLDRAAVEAALAPFFGVIRQVPPAHSALKQDGERLYEKARRGETVEVAARDVLVHDLTLERLDLESGGSPQFVVRVRCGKGFYVRSLARDLGVALGCGAHLAALRRTATAGFTVADARRPEDLLDGDAWRAALVPVERALGHLPVVALSAEDARRVWHGNPIPWAASEEPPVGPTRLSAPDGSLLAVGEVRVDASDAVLHVLRGFRGGWQPPLDDGGPLLAEPPPGAAG